MTTACATRTFPVHQVQLAPASSARERNARSSSSANTPSTREREARAAGRAVRLAADDALAPRVRAALARCALGAAAWASCAALAAAQAPVLLASTTDDLAAVPGSQPAVDEAALVRLESGALPRVWMQPAHWLASAGFEPGDVDAIALRPGLDPAHYRSLAFSLQGNEGGALDGDVLMIGTDGKVDILYSEFELAQLMAANGANFDLDGLAFDGLGRLLFSLQDNLAGTGLGDVLDGDVLRLETNGAIVRAFAEADVQALVQTATGSSAAIADVLALEWHAGETWVVVQSPSGVDGAVIALDPVAQVRYTESELGLGGAELDALSVWPQQADGLALDFGPAVAAPGAQVHGEVHGGVPGRPVWVAIAGNAGFLNGAGFGGCGAWFLDPSDPALLGSIAAGNFAIGLLDAQGSLSQDFTLPTGSFGGLGFDQESGWTFQALDLVDLRLSLPFRLRVQ